MDDKAVQGLIKGSRAIVDDGISCWKKELGEKVV